MNCDDQNFSEAASLYKAAGSFTSDKMAFIKTLLQNFVLSTEQTAVLLKEISMSGDKLKALELFRDSLKNPSSADPIVQLFSMSGDKEAAAKTLSSFKATAPFEIKPFKIEDDGHRSPKEMERLLGAIKAASMSSDKVRVCEDEVKIAPNPPLDVSQLMQVLKLVNFSGDAVRVLSVWNGPKLVYPATCAELVSLLGIWSMSSDKLAILPQLKQLIADPQNKLKLVASFTFSGDKTKAEEILRDVVVQRAPPAGPPPNIQAALQKVGRCPAGYTWRQVLGGYRCAAGGHFVSDSTLELALK